MSKKKSKVHFKIQLEKIEGASVMFANKPFRLQWKCGQNCGSSRTYIIYARDMMINYVLEFQTKLHYVETHGEKVHAEKKLFIKLIAEKCNEFKKDRSVCECSINLGECAQLGIYKKRSLFIMPKNVQFCNCWLYAIIEAKMLKVNGKKVSLENQQREATEKAREFKSSLQANSIMSNGSLRHNEQPSKNTAPKNNSSRSQNSSVLDAGEAVGRKLNIDSNDLQSSRNKTIESFSTQSMAETKRKSLKSASGEFDEDGNIGNSGKLHLSKNMSVASKQFQLNHLMQSANELEQLDYKLVNLESEVQRMNQAIKKGGNKSICDIPSDLCANVGVSRAASDASVCERQENLILENLLYQMLRLREEIGFRKMIEKKLYNCRWQYDSDGNSKSSKKFAAFLLEKKVLEEQERTEWIMQILRGLLCQIERGSKDLNLLLGTLKWIETMVVCISKDTSVRSVLELGQYSWIVHIEEHGLKICEGELPFTQILQLIDKNVMRIENENEPINSYLWTIEIFFLLIEKIVNYLYWKIMSCDILKVYKMQIDLLFIMEVKKCKSDLTGISSSQQHCGTKIGEHTEYLTELISSIKKHHINQVIESQILTQILNWTSCYTLNYLFSHERACCAVVGLGLKMACFCTSEWIDTYASKLFSKQLKNELELMREAADLLILDKSHTRNASQILSIFSILNPTQINKIIRNFKPDENHPDPIPQELRNDFECHANSSNTKFSYFSESSIVQILPQKTMDEQVLNSQYV